MAALAQRHSYTLPNQQFVFVLGITSHHKLCCMWTILMQYYDIILHTVSSVHPQVEVGGKYLWCTRYSVDTQAIQHESHIQKLQTARTTRDDGFSYRKGPASVNPELRLSSPFLLSLKVCPLGANSSSPAQSGHTVPCPVFISDRLIVVVTISQQHKRGRQM